MQTEGDAHRGGPRGVGADTTPVVAGTDDPRPETRRVPSKDVRFTGWCAKNGIFSVKTENCAVPADSISGITSGTLAIFDVGKRLIGLNTEGVVQEVRPGTDFGADRRSDSNRITTGPTTTRGATTGITDVRPSGTTTGILRFLRPGHEGVGRRGSDHFVGQSEPGGASTIDQHGAFDHPRRGDHPEVSGRCH